MSHNKSEKSSDTSFLVGIFPNNQKAVQHRPPTLFLDSVSLRSVFFNDSGYFLKFLFKKVTYFCMRWESKYPTIFRSLRPGGDCRTCRIHCILRYESQCLQSAPPSKTRRHKRCRTRFSMFFWYLRPSVSTTRPVSVFS